MNILKLVWKARSYLVERKCILNSIGIVFKELGYEMLKCVILD